MVLYRDADYGGTSTIGLPRHQAAGNRPMNCSIKLILDVHL